MGPLANPIKTSIFTKNAPAAIGPYSQAVKANHFLFISGQIPIEPNSQRVMLFNGNIEEQCHLVLSNLQNILTAAGLTFEHVVKTTVYLKSMDDFSAMNRVYEKFFGTSKPARATLAVAGLPAGVAVEIDAIAVTE